jgi:hypothetical protein
MVKIEQLELGSRIDDFLDVVGDIYRGDPVFVRVPDDALRDRLHPKKNPFFAHAEGALFCAYRDDGRCVGRVTAQVDRAHLERYRDDTGFFGFFDTVDDEEAAGALLEGASRWLVGKGMKRVVGPMSLSINEEIGCLVDGFDTPPYVLMPHHRPYQSVLIERAGFAKVKDVFAWRCIDPNPGPRVLRAQEAIRTSPEITFRTFKAKSIHEDVRLMFDILNDAFSDHWGFVPMTAAEIENSANFFRSILVPEFSCLVSIDGEPAAVALGIPNLNECVRDLNGRLSPIGLLKFFWRLKVQGTRTARLPLLGIRKKWRAVRKYAGMSGFIYARLAEAGRRAGIREWEFGWTLDSNGPVHAGIRLMGGRRCKTYRLYEKKLPAELA